MAPTLVKVIPAFMLQWPIILNSVISISGNISPFSLLSTHLNVVFFCDSKVQYEEIYSTKLGKIHSCALHFTC